MNSILLQDYCTDYKRIFKNAFSLHDEFHDLVLEKSGEVFSISVKGTKGVIHFHEQEIAEQLNILSPGPDHLTEFIYVIYTGGLNLKRARDYQIKLLVEGCPHIFLNGTETTDK